MMDIKTASELINRQEIDYQSLLGILGEYARPRDKISAWLKSGHLISVKKGLYVFGAEVTQSPYSLEILANLIYGPSAISLTYALSYYGLIPEKVATVTSITNKRNKLFNTPIATFSYQYINNKKYPIGIELLEKNNKSHFLIASPEKALCDYIFLIDKKISLQTTEEAERYLLLDLRLDENGLHDFNLSKLKEISLIYEDPRLEQIINFLNKW